MMPSRRAPCRTCGNVSHGAAAGGSVTCLLEKGPQRTGSCPRAQRLAKEMNVISFRPGVLSAAVAAGFVIAMPSAQAANAVTFKPWGDDAGNAPSLNVGDVLSVTKGGVGASNYSDNPSLLNAAWAHSGGAPWYTFFLTAEADVSISLTPTDGAGTLFNPGMTVWASGDTKFNGGTADFDDIAMNGWNSPHSFNVVGQIGDAGTLWSTGANGNQLETLAYAVTGESHAAADNGWGETIQTGFHDVSVSNTFEQGITGSASGNSILMQFSSMQSGWYTIFFGGTNHDLTAVSYDLSVAAVAAVPEPEACAMLLAGLAMVGAIARRRRG
jgi:hypothetical protein